MQAPDCAKETVRAAFVSLARIADLGLAGWLSQHQSLWTSAVGAGPDLGEEVLLVISAVFGSAKVVGSTFSCNEDLLNFVLVRTFDQVQLLLTVSSG